MKPAPKHDGSLLNEDGIRITLTHLITDGKSLKWSDLGIVRIVRHGNFITKFTNPTFQLMVAKKGASLPSSVFQTQDAELVKRIEAAINEVAQHRRATREK
jgi:hypothetical protein